ncbi:helix-turn-helix domain-containing protein [Acetatifactor aquisgranensis]|uniref:helix-turn-helix domain-containing protein n=1 Tax=Acetatifactor aquisgranensis TaxID=2941233 RepID=UPI00203F6833|nr:AraC family transcriptional regulator [Acetatifactor aquisgranensis]
MHQLNFCEYNRSNHDYDTIFRPAGSGDYLFLQFKSPMKVYTEDRIVITKENACILYTPGMPQHYQAVQKFRNSYLHFSSDENPARCFPMPENTVFYPENAMQIDSLISRLQQEYFSGLPHREEAVHALMTLLFLSISRRLTQETAQKEEAGLLYPLFQSLRLEMLTECEKDWDLERLCRRVNLEKSQFYMYYRSFFSSTPKNDLLHARLEKAKNLLSNEALQVKEVAQLCGFGSQAHFTRYFKSCCGCAPGAYARQPRM